MSSEEETDGLNVTGENCEETDGLNVTIESTGDDGSLYVPTPQRLVRENVLIVRNVPSKNICFMDLNQFDKFIKQVNEVRCCATPINKVSRT